MLGNLKAKMGRYDIAVNDLAACTGLSRSTITSKLRGRSDFSIYDAIAIRDKFFPGASLSELFAKENPPA